LWLKPQGLSIGATNSDAHTRCSRKAFFEKLSCQWILHLAPQDPPQGPCPIFGFITLARQSISDAILDR
jgi:hypothetical protein